MTLQQLKYVTAIADCGSMNEAAKTLFVSQPSLSGAVKELEEEAGIEIFKRTNKGVLPTPEGHFDKNGIFTADRERTGDECDMGLWVSSDIGVVRVLLDV